MIKMNRTMKKISGLCFYTIGIFGCLLLGAMDVFSATNAVKAVVAPAKPAPPKKVPFTNPDFTKGGQPDGSADWTLGPTGLRGWIYGDKGQTSEARQILVTAVAKGSPADGKLIPGDVILGAGGQLFAADARITFAKAIAVAESDKGGGKLQLLRWRAGKTDPVELQLKVMGTYSDTAPYDCPKSKKVFELGCEAIAKRGLKGESVPNNLNALALLASGKPEYRPLLAAYAKQVADHKFDGYVNWDYGYAEIFLAEYVMATGDQSVFEGLKRIALEIVQSQSAVGTWGHRAALPTGNINGYGCMNQPGITLTIGMVLAREAGVKDPALDRAITKAAGFLRWYANKGAIPYGDHQPWASHEDNGKCSSAAVLFDLLGDREAAEFFAKMATAAYNERETGHTGCYFNNAWALPAVIRCGPFASGAYLKQKSWYYDFARCWDGSVVYQGSTRGEQEFACYKNWDCTGSYLLAFAAPQKSLYLTGKKSFAFPSLNAKQAAEVIAAGSDFTSATQATAYDGRTTEQLVAGLSSWSPAVRMRSAQSLAKRQGDFVPELLKMLAGSNRYARYGACETLALLGPRGDATAPQLRALLKDPDPWTQNQASLALAALGPEARKASVPDLLMMAVTPNPADPRRVAQRAAGIALFSPPPGASVPKSILAGSLEGVDRRLLIPAIESLLKNEDGAARGGVSAIYSKLTDSDVAALLPAIIKAAEVKAPSGEMFSEGVRLAGLDLLSKRNIREGMAVCVALSNPVGGANLGKCMEYLKRYGVHAKEVLPQLREVRGKYEERRDKAGMALFDKTIAEIEASKVAPKIVGMNEFIAKYKSAK